MSNKVACPRRDQAGVARRLAASGASVALAYSAHAKPAQRLADELEPQLGSVDGGMYLH